MTIYEEFLRLLDFSDEEMPVQLPLWENACRLLGLNAKDVKFAAREWIPTYWDLSLHGVRKCIGAYVRELIEMTRLSEYKASGAKILYGNVPSHPACMYANKIAGGDNIHISHPDYLMATVLNAFFHKTTVLSGNDSSCMNPLCHHCGMNRLRADARYKGLIVSPTVVWNWGLYCNEAHKTEELIKNMDQEEWNYVLSTIPKDYRSDIPESEDEQRVNYLAKQLMEGQKQVSAYTGIEVQDIHVIQAMEEYLNYIDKVEELTNLVLLADPQPITGNELTIFGAPTQMAFNAGFSLLTEAIDIMIQEVKERIAKKEGLLPMGAPRLACQFVPFCVPWVNKAFNENGINLSINTFFAPASKQKQYFDKNRIYQSVAQQWFSNPSAVNMRNEIDLVCEILTSYPLDGVLYGFFSFDRWIGGLQKTMVKIVEEKTGIPHYYLEGDFWSDDKYSLENRITRIQNIAYSIKINHMVSGWKYAKKQDTE